MQKTPSRLKTSKRIHSTSSNHLIPFREYREKVLGCWLGKAVGGTLGGPYEGKMGPHTLRFYDPVPKEMLPNDDLDLQVIWLEAIRKNGLPVDRRMLGNAWLKHIRMFPDEYGIAIRNLNHGLYPPLSGSFDNGFTAGMGSAIRTELWACLAPGDPELARHLAVEDACVDHADEGIYASLYFVTLESAAFVISDREKLLDLAASSIPANSRVGRAVSDTRKWWAQNPDWISVRNKILEKHGLQNFTDVAMNLAFTILGWLAGENDFGKSICTAVNCGMDTDCTGATLGAILGIIHPRKISKNWLKPIGQDLVLSPSIVAMHQAGTLDEFTDQVATLSTDILSFYDSKTTLTGIPSLNRIRNGMAPPRHPASRSLFLASPEIRQESLIGTEPLIVQAVYPPQTAFVPHQPENLELKITNPSDGVATVRLEVLVDDGWRVLSPSESDFKLSPHQEKAIHLKLIYEPHQDLRIYQNSLYLKFLVNGMPYHLEAGLIPTIPWLRWETKNDHCMEIFEKPPIPVQKGKFEVSGHFQDIPEGPHTYAVDLKVPCPGLRLVVQANRNLKAWFDENLVLNHRGIYQVPAVSRPGHTGVNLQIKPGWHRITISVDDGEKGKLFVGIGADNLGWLRNPEWRYPLEKK